MHTLLDLLGNIPTFIHISDGKMHAVNALDQLVPEPGAFYIVDRGFLDFERLHRFHEAGSFFVIRGKSNLALFASSRSYNGIDLRPNGCAYWVLLAKRFRYTVAAYSFQGSADRKASDLSDEQLCVARAHHHRSVSVPMAGGVVFQMDQAASSHQTVLRYFRERGENADLDRRVGVCIGSYRQKTFKSKSQPL